MSESKKYIAELPNCVNAIIEANKTLWIKQQETKKLLENWKLVGKLSEEQSRQFKIEVSESTYRELEAEDDVKEATKRLEDLQIALDKLTDTKKISWLTILKEKILKFFSKL